MRKKTSRANKGQFFVIAALLVSVVLVGGVISTYTWVRHPSVAESPDVLGAIGEMNADIKSVLDFTVGYYGSILQVTGNATYAEGLTNTYLSSGLVNIARSHPEWNPSFTLNSKDVSTKWFMPESKSSGDISVTYSLGALGIEGVKYETSSALTVEMLTAAAGQARIEVTRDNSEPELGLTTSNFWFYNYSYTDSKWELVNPSSIDISSNGIYTIPLPNGVGPDSYSVQIEDRRGLVVSAFYSEACVASESKIPHYTYTFDWESTGVLDIYDSLSTDDFVIELLQNGTMKWLGRSLEITPDALPLPPVSVKAFRVNATTSSGNNQIPFQVEDWSADYKVPLGLSGNESLFTSTNMLVFLVNNDVEKITLWWDGNDTAIPTPYAHQKNIYGSISSTYHISLSNGRIGLNVDIDTASSSRDLTVTSTAGGVTSEAKFLLVNGEDAKYWASTSVVIANGSVRAILQQEPEYGSGGATNMYAQLIFTLPVNTNYYTYTTRIICVDSSSSPRTINDLTAVRLHASSWSPLTENGTLAGYPVPDSNEGTFYDHSAGSHIEHHWSEFLSGSSGTGVMFRDVDTNLYNFNDEFSCNTATVVVDDSNRLIEINPVDMGSVAFDNPLDASWQGAVATFTSEPIHPSSGQNGLWVMVENPPSISMVEVPSENDFVDKLSNIDSSPDKGSHSSFVSQKSGPNSVYDTLTEYGGSAIVYENSAQSSSAVSQTSHSFNYALQQSSGNDRLVVATVSWEDAQASASVSSITFDGTAMIPVTDVTVGSGYSEFISLWYLLDSSLPSASGSYAVEVTTTETITEPIYVAVSEYSGVQQSAPDDFDTHSSTSGNTQVTLTAVADGSLVVAGVGEGGTNILDNTNNIDNLQSERFSSSGSALGHHTNVATGDITVGWNNLATREGMVAAVWQPSVSDFELDLEVQWSSADFDETNEELCIYVGEVSAEDLRVDVWTGSGWDNLFSSLNVGWNNATVTSYLIDYTFTIRFVGSTETGDTTQDYWTIDATLLHTWS